MTYRSHTPPSPNTRERLIILGSGFAAMSTLKSIDLERYHVTVVSTRNHFLFTPLLPSTTVGTVEFRSIIEPVRKARRGIEFYQGTCTAIDFEERCVTVDSVEPGTTFTLRYDVLVIAVGAWNNTFGIPGVVAHAHFLKQISDARRIREKVIECLERAEVPGIGPEERARLLHFVVVGGGPTGVEFAAELHDLLEDDLQKSYPNVESEVRITLFEAMRSILSTFDSDLREYTMRHFRRHGIEIRLGTPVSSVGDGYLELEGGERIPAGLIVWSTGYGPTGLTSSLKVARERGRILTDEFLRIPEHPEVYAAGDCATIVGHSMPQTAQLAMQEGKYLARALNRRASERTVKPFRFNDLGMLAYVGDSKALADVPRRRIHLRGALTFLFWRSAYLTRLVGLKNKVLVAFDWMKTAVFGRDMSRF